MKRVTVTQAVRSFKELVNEIERTGEEVLLMRGGHTVARLIPEPAEQTALQIFEGLEGILDEDTGEKMSAAIAKTRDEHRLDELRDPWTP